MNANQSMLIHQAEFCRIHGMAGTLIHGLSSSLALRGMPVFCGNAGNQNNLHIETRRAAAKRFAANS
jgi:hypothetical protein